jgi:hypothetical protein
VEMSYQNMSTNIATIVSQSFRFFWHESSKDTQKLYPWQRSYNKLIVRLTKKS